ncbi:MAG: adenylate kinase [Lachnospiraceae bacterium]|nr:adenylate kinase [Lachnospiraceae bacterium]
MKIIMLGEPGAGKGTQAMRITEKYQIPHISTGDIFRANIKAETELGKEAKTYIDKGLLVPDSVTENMVLDRISQPDCNGGYILDGYPRTIPQADFLWDALAEKGETIDYAINIRVSDDEIIERIAGRRACPKCGSTYHIAYAAPEKEGVCDKCGAELYLRDDDRPETVKKRLEVFHEISEPLIKYFNKKGVLRTVDGTQEMEQVFQDITDILGE